MNTTILEQNLICFREQVSREIKRITLLRELWSRSFEVVIYRCSLFGFNELSETIQVEKKGNWEFLSQQLSYLEDFHGQSVGTLEDISQINSKKLMIKNKMAEYRSEFGGNFCPWYKP